MSDNSLTTLNFFLLKSLLLFTLSLSSVDSLITDFSRLSLPSFFDRLAEILAEII